ncbi:MAG: hypothetical protein KAT56_03305 [Sedimentisphaerales bacterium]|nr:hypothetical protein [Sedimentisphaerales bacterium]
MNPPGIATEENPTILELACCLKFKWINPQSGVLTEVNRRIEKRTFNWEPGMFVIPWPNTDNKRIGEYGKELVNVMLPKVIETEIKKCAYLK